MDELFDLRPTEAGPAEPEGRGRPRLQHPRRDQITLRPSDLESLLPADHRARLVWAFFGALVLAAGYAVVALLLPVRGRVRRMAAAAVIGAGLALAWVALLSGTSPAPVQSYRIVDPQTIVVVVGGAPHGWTRVSGVAESATTVAVSAQTTTWLPGPGTSELELVELTVRLAQPLDGRTVTDGSGQAVPLAQRPGQR